VVLMSMAGENPDFSEKVVGFVCGVTTLSSQNADI
jgi:hypothetical protein